MAAPPAGAQVVSPFPNPPIYSKFYTSEAVASGTAPLPPCMHADFTAFGEEYHLNDEVIRPLADTGIRQLYVNKKEWKAEMKKLNSSAVAAFVDLISILISSPESTERTDKLNDIRDIFINMHHLINEFRPIQARDTLRMMQQKQLSELEATVKDFKDFLDEAKKTFRKSLKVEEVRRLPIPAYRPDLEGPEEEGEERRKGESVEQEMSLLNMAETERKPVRLHASGHRTEQRTHMIQRAKRDVELWGQIFGEKMEH